MILLNLALKSIANRLTTSLLTIFSIALSTALLLSVEKAKRASEEGFTQTISKTSLIVGAKTSPVNLLLYTVFNMGNPTNNVSWQSYEHFKKHPAVDWLIPYSLGDGHRGFRVVGTTKDFFEHYRFRGDQAVQINEGKIFEDLWDVVIGSTVAARLGYKIGDSIVVAHGVTKSQGFQNHDDKPFRVAGIMKPTGTALDQSLYISLEGFEAIHLDWQSGAAPTESQKIPKDQIKTENIKINSITSFFLGAKSPISTLGLQREINEYNEEGLLAVIPGVALAELWRGLSYFENALRGISWMVILVGLVSMLIALLTSLNERRREMSILRSLGAGPKNILNLMIFESSLLTLAGVICGVVIHLVVFRVLKSWLETEFSLYVVGDVLAFREMVYLTVTMALGILIGVIPAIRSMRLALKDGLSMRV